ncbi:rod shape-determining protein MreC [Enterococcus faecalis]|nr:rod shape-determining protein MreC [Enterococcus faecalis]
MKNKEIITIFLVALLGIVLFYVFKDPFIKNVTNIATTQKENKKLRDKIDNSMQLELDLENDKRTLAHLKQEKQLQEKLISHDKVVANIIKRDTATWNDELVIDKGSDNNLAPNMTVLSQAGVIGRISNVSKNQSTVTLLSATKKLNVNSFSVRVQNTKHNSIGIVTGYDLEKNELSISDILDSDKFQKGDPVTTSGIGGKTPADLPVGTVKSTKQNQTDIAKHIVIEPYANFEDIMFATVIKE